MTPAPLLTAFQGDRQVAAGSPADVLAAIAPLSPVQGPILVFDDATGRPAEPDALPVPRAGPGRPRLGVEGREITLLPRHWEWLARQPRGASATLRRLVELEMRRDPHGERVRAAQDATSRVLTALAGDRVGYEEATRALYAGDGEAFHRLIAGWPEDVRAYAHRLSAPAFAAPAG